MVIRTLWQKKNIDIQNVCLDGYRDISLHPNGYFTYNVLLALSVFTDYNPDLNN